jgi:hypothetical protein
MASALVVFLGEKQKSKRAILFIANDAEGV